MGAAAFHADREVFARFPGTRLAVVVAHDVDNAAGRPAVAARWQAAWDAAGAAVAPHGNAQSHPRVRPWRERFRAAGVSPRDFPPSIEAMLRRAAKGGEAFRVNPLVDCYNAVSLRHVVPVGGFDLDRLGGPVELRLTREGDTFAALDAADAVPVAPGEVAYTDGATVLTRHFVWRQARGGLIGPATRSVFLVSEILGEVGHEVAAAVLEALREGLRDGFGVHPRTWLLDETAPAATW